jgi:type VI secretion system protein ImpF
LPIVASLLDRLFDNDVKIFEEPPIRRFANFGQLKHAVARDLEWLLNTRREWSDENKESFPEASRSILSFGLPEFTGLGINNPDDRAYLRYALEQAIAQGEPRLRQIRVTMEGSEADGRSLRFRVDAVLQVEPMREPVSFDAVLRLDSNQYIVRQD